MIPKATIGTRITSPVAITEPQSVPVWPINWAAATGIVCVLCS